MPRLRRVGPTSDSAPVELLDRDDDVWQSVDATERWYAANRMHVMGVSPFGPVNRWSEAVTVWARQVGLVKLYEGGTPWPDWQSLKQLGIPPMTSGRAREKVAYRTLGHEWTEADRPKF